MQNEVDEFVKETSGEVKLNQTFYCTFIMLIKDVEKLKCVFCSQCKWELKCSVSCRDYCSLLKVVWIPES